MNKWQSLVSTVLGAACLVLAIAVVWAGQTTQQIQMQMQMKQNEINSGLLGQAGSQLGTSILRDMANVAVNNQRVRKVLSDNGYNLNVNAPEASAKNVRKTNE